MSKSRQIGHVAAFFTVFIWGTTFISTKVLLRDFQPVEILFFRFSMGFLALCLSFRFARIPPEQKALEYGYIRWQHSG